MIKALLWAAAPVVVVLGCVFLALYTDTIAGVASMVAVGVTAVSVFRAGVNSFCNFVFNRAKERNVDLEAILGITKRA